MNMALNLTCNKQPNTNASKLVRVRTSVLQVTSTQLIISSIMTGIDVSKFVVWNYNSVHCSVDQKPKKCQPWRRMQVKFDKSENLKETKTQGVICYNAESEGA